MKLYWISSLFVLLFISCQTRVKIDDSIASKIQGTWELIDVTNKVAGQTLNTFVPGRRMIKIITPSHFSFVNHDLNKGQDSTAFFAAGAGLYSIEGTSYTEQLEYCTARDWEGHVFSFEVEIKGDTLIQQGIEKSEELGVDRYIIETYIRK